MENIVVLRLKDVSLGHQDRTTLKKVKTSKSLFRDFLVSINQIDHRESQYRGPHTQGSILRAPRLNASWKRSKFQSHYSFVQFEQFYWNGFIFSIIKHYFWNFISQKFQENVKKSKKSENLKKDFCSNKNLFLKIFLKFSSILNRLNLINFNMRTKRKSPYRPQGLYVS